MSNFNLVFVILISITISIDSYACGPDFPGRHLFQSQISLYEKATITLQRIISNIYKKPPAFKPYREIDQYLRWNIETDGLSSAEIQTLLNMRNQADADDAYNLGVTLPEEIRAYTAGAVAFQGEDLPFAIGYFQKVLALPKREKIKREVWATYMLGRAEFNINNDQSAANYFQMVRELVATGAEDPLGLAQASLGDEAAIYLRSKQISRAVDLYFQQASHSSPEALLSLQLVAKEIAENKNYLGNSFNDLLIRSLVIYYSNIYNWPKTSNDESNLDNPGNGSKHNNKFDMAFVEKFVSSFEQKNPMSPIGASWLAGAIYNQGWFDLAERLINVEKSPMSLWIAAKLAVRRGDRDRAALLYHEAIDFLKKGEEIDRGILCGVRAELGSLYVSRNDYILALKIFFNLSQEAWNGNRWSSDYWIDVAYISEMILTVDELKDFVSENIPESAIDAMESGSNALNSSPATELRHLLGRRLLRSARFSEAPTYFDDIILKAKAQSFVNMRSLLNVFWLDNISKSHLLSELAKLSRNDGMALLAYELHPDYAIYDGDYEDNMGKDSIYYVEKTPKNKSAASHDGHDDNSSNSNRYKVPVSADERKRITQNNPETHIRFHYRLEAGNYLSHAADLLPPRSQAFAAVLCKAYAYIRYKYPEKALPFYQRYVKEGAFVPWAELFGSQCPEPDFSSARRLAVKQNLKLLYKNVKPYQSFFLIFLITSLLAIYRKRILKIIRVM